MNSVKIFYALMALLLCFAPLLSAKADHSTVPTLASLETVSSICLGTEVDGKPVTHLNLGTVMVSPSENISAELNCDGTASLNHHWVKDGFEMTLTGKPRAIQVVEGKLNGQFKETIAPTDVGGTEIDPDDIVKTNEDGSIVVRRAYREIYILTLLNDEGDLQGDTHLIHRFIFKLNGKGQPVMGQDHYLGLIDAPDLATAIGGEPADYQSGIYIAEGIKSALTSCVFLSDPIHAKDCAANLQMRKHAFPVGPDYQPDFATSVGFQHSQTALPATQVPGIRIVLTSRKPCQSSRKMLPCLQLRTR